MAGKGLVLRSTFLLFCTITMISAAPLKHFIEGTNNGSSAGYKGCIALPANCFAGNWTGGICAPCPYDPLHCCALSLGNCTSADGAPYGLCAPACGCYGY